MIKADSGIVKAALANAIERITPPAHAELEAIAGTIMSEERAERLGQRVVTRAHRLARELRRS